MFIENFHVLYLKHKHARNQHFNNNNIYIFSKIIVFGMITLRN